MVAVALFAAAGGVAGSAGAQAAGPPVPPPAEPSVPPPASAAIEPAGPPTTTDLDVLFIERLPRYDYDAAKNNPVPGDVVTFRAHVKNWGPAALSPDYRWDIDGVPTASGTAANIGSNEDRVLTLDWVWQAGDHTVRLAVDVANAIPEVSEANNAVEDRINGIIVGFWVEQSVYDYFHSYQKNLPGVGSNSWEDWAQRQMRYWNQFSASAIYTTTPQGVLDRVRIDKIVVVPDGALPLHGGLPTNHPDLQDRTVDMMWGFPATLLSGGMYSNTTSTSMSNPFFYEGSLLHELGHARYLIDAYGFDVHNTAAHHSVQIYEGSTYVAGSAYMPFLAFGEVLYYNKYGKMMSGGYDQGWSEYDAGALNRIAGCRARCGNYNAPCNIGEFLQDLPENNHVQILDQYGRPRPGAYVRLYRAVGDYQSWYGKTFDNIPDAEYTADRNGYIHLPRNPFTDGGPIRHWWGEANGVLILRIAHSGQIWYRFQEVTDFNIQYWRGNTQDAYYAVAVSGANADFFADYDRDGDTDVADFATFQRCFNGPGRPRPATCSADADYDDDGDVDVNDFAVFQTCFNGPGNLPACIP